MENINLYHSEYSKPKKSVKKPKKGDESKKPNLTRILLKKVMSLPYLPPGRIFKTCEVYDQFFN